MRTVFRTVAGGLAIVLPLLVTLWLLVWFTQGAENVLGGPLQYLLGTEAKAGKLTKNEYVPGMGIALGIVLAVVIGLLARFWLVRGLVEWFEHLIGRIPLLKTLYGGVKDLLGFVGGKKRSFSRVVLVRVPNTDFRMLGFVTQESLEAIPGLHGLKDRVAVFISLSYNLGGYTMLVSREDIETTDMTVEEALRFALTAGVSTDEEKTGEAIAAKLPAP